MESVKSVADGSEVCFVFARVHFRAEHFFKRAVRAEPADAEALGRYAAFLWQARNDLAAAEETYQEAIAADPGNAHHAAAYAHFLWNTGGEDTCYPLD
jgi:Tfp pilus assembly protein PilF